MSDDANGELTISKIVELVEQDQFEAALFLLDGRLQYRAASAYEAGRLTALKWYCQYMLDDEIDEDGLSRHVAEETRADFLAGFGIQLSELDALHLAELVLKRLTAVAPGDVRAWYNYGYILSKQEDWQPAIEALERAQALDVTLAIAHYELGHCYLRTDAPQLAAVAFERFLSLEPDDVDALVLAGIAHSDAGDYDKATALLEKATTVDPQDPSACFNLAVVAHRTGDLVRLQALQECICQISPEDWRASLIAAKAHELQDELQDAWTCMDDAFSRAVEAQDWASLDAIAESALGFAFEHGFGDHIGPWIENVFHHHCLARRTLHFLRALTEPVLAQASSFRVILEGQQPVEEGPLEERERSGQEILGYFRTLRIFAETAKEAEALAMAFDRRLGGQPVSAETLDAEPGMVNVHRGVHWCAKGVTLFPLNLEPGAEG